MREVVKNYDVVVVGGGMSGVCAAVSAARNGAKTVLVQNRPVLGGNGSSEIKVGVNGAARGRQGEATSFKNAIESGVILELIMKNKKVNPQHSFHVMDTVTWDLVKTQENLDLYLNTHMSEVEMDGNSIVAVKALQSTTNTMYTFKGTSFIDTTGDADVAYLAGADYTIGREGKDVYGESWAPDESDSHTMGSTILFEARHTGKPTTFKRPSWAYEVTEKMVGGRRIHEVEDGYWWVEVGGDDLKIIEDAEEIRDELLKYAYGAFDYVKNSGKFPEADDIVMTWIAPIPGKRESRRVYGDYVLNQNDCYEGCRFDDAVAYGGWSLDDHTSGGIRSKIESHRTGLGSVWHDIKDIYAIPYRCLYSRNVENLYIGGRAISASHMAMSSTRVIGTCSVIGQAIGTAAAIATKYGVTSAREVSKYMDELQQTLIKDDAYIPGIVTKDALDLVSNSDCKITASSCVKGGEPTNINGDYARRVDEVQNAWISEKISADGEWIDIKFPETVEMSEVLLRLDPNFSRVLAPTIAVGQHKHIVEDMPYQLVKDYEVQLLQGGNVVKTIVVEENYLRVNTHKFDTVQCDEIKVLVKTNYGDDAARIFEIRAYK